MVVDFSHPSGSRRFTLIGADGATYLNPIRGTLGGHRRSKIFGRLDCPAALRAIARGGYVTHRVFFVDADTATSAGYRPCATCMPDACREWRTSPEEVFNGVSRGTSG
jgi:hypothetical protein